MWGQAVASCAQVLHDGGLIVGHILQPARVGGDAVELPEIDPGPVVAISNFLPKYMFMSRVTADVPNYGTA